MLYGLNVYLLIYYSSRSRKLHTDRLPAGPVADREWPPVTVQIPIYNEKNVSERIIRAAAQLDYPADRLEIQILDDSTDETSALIDRVVEEIKSRGVHINTVRRANRTGFKAGALGHATAQARGEFLAVFYADFEPKPDFLRRTLPPFLQDQRIAFVQARWDHLNRRENVLTRCQSLGIDGHFLIEQEARAGAGLFMNFNGTAGIWRRRAIEEVGGWSSQTLTEDMDLSYRVQLAGWKPYYLKDVVVPAEIPATMTGAKSQQFRWAKGSIQTSLIMLPRVWRGPYTAMQKIQAFLHLTNYCIHPLIVTLALLALPILALDLIQTSRYWIALFALPLLAATFGPSTMYAVAAIRNPAGRLSLLAWLPLLVLYGTGIAISNSIAVYEAVVGKTSAFIRTPKKGDRRSSDYQLKKDRVWIFEILLGLYSIGSIAAGISSGNYGILPFLLIFAVGFTTVGVRTAFGLASDA